DSIINLSVEFLNKMQTGLEIKINPVEIALYALEQKNLGLFKLALCQLPNVNEVIDAEQNTLLHLAAIQGQTKMVECLINRGADLKKRNAAGLKAQSLARQAGFEETADNIAVLKLTPVLERMGFFDGLRQLEILKEEVAQLKKVSMGL
ncbi:MAG: ankyrin repeat domain-containing protein, partial [Silvanigrellaceae bacterium]|nr:ankyrin repeat domain-containing protein [Silvanigrellaceae bacterium]